MKTDSMRPRLWLRIVRWTAIVIVLLAGLALFWGLYVFRDRTPGYTLNLRLEDKPSRASPRPLRVGFGRVKINPDLSNTNRPVWLAGFSHHRAATALHDDLWAVACVLDDGYTRLGLVALDAIGLFHDDVLAVRRALQPDWQIHYAIVCTTHNHSTPDLMGLWGPDFLHTGVNPAYRRHVIAGAAAALGQAVAALREARVAVHEIPTTAEGLLADTRRPEVYDHGLRILHFLGGSGPHTLGTVVAWANHPETVWSKNTEVTADFPGYLRDALEHGIAEDGRAVDPGVGGVHLYVNGAIGGLMSTTPSVTVRDPYRQEDFKKPSHEKARALGRQLASRVLPHLRDSSVEFTNHLSLAVAAKTIGLPLENNAFLLASFLGLMDRGHVRWKTIRSEVALVTLGEVSLACVPGEIYPELVNGGIATPPGADFQVNAVEMPVLRELMPGRVKFLLGLANDEIGYIIPKSEWDTQPPYLYNSKKKPYGEINSLGPNTASHIQRALAELCR